MYTVYAKWSRWFLNKQSTHIKTTTGKDFAGKHTPLLQSFIVLSHVPCVFQENEFAPERGIRNFSIR